LFRRLAKAIPRCQRNPPAVLSSYVSHVEHDCGKPAGLQQQIDGAQSLLQT
jgi:hypothetical protein